MGVVFCTGKLDRNRTEVGIVGIKSGERGKAYTVGKG